MMCSFADDLSIVLPAVSGRTDDFQRRSEFAAGFGPRYDVLFGLRQLDVVKRVFARYGAVQLKNVLNRVESKWLQQYYASKSEWAQTPRRDDRVSSLYLQEVQELVSYIVGSPLRGAGAVFVDFEDSDMFQQQHDHTFCPFLGSRACFYSQSRQGAQKIHPGIPRNS